MSNRTAVYGFQSVFRQSGHRAVERQCRVRVQPTSTREWPVKLVDILKKQLGTFGYEQEAVRTLPIMQSKNVVTDHLVYATKDPLGNKI
jgi:hypothetical protein